MCNLRYSYFILLIIIKKIKSSQVTTLWGHVYVNIQVYKQMRVYAYFYAFFLHSSIAFHSNLAFLLCVTGKAHGSFRLHALSVGDCSIATILQQGTFCSKRYSSACGLALLPISRRLHESSVQAWPTIRAFPDADKYKITNEN